jgi:predicted nucleic acid-binding protein
VRFLDTNVLLYLVSTNPNEAPKARAAAAILEEGDLALSVQVLQEFYVQATRHRPSGRGSLTHKQASDLIEAFLRFPVQEMTVSLLKGALAARERYGISFWDASILEAARIAGCDTVLSEDLSHGRRYGPVKVVNPFR